MQQVERIRDCQGLIFILGGTAGRGVNGIVCGLDLVPVFMCMSLSVQHCRFCSAQLTPASTARDPPSRALADVCTEEEVRTLML